ncbi:MAG: HEAT repeat domain-containing protein [Planctomycetota bacterium]|nr:MAG: HEAT repeat domain-containing protein [Planctomycetota bacterium]REK38251.1 MAG: HEAT repeat domain-containing protein [Planctomycetota bacterium]
MMMPSWPYIVAAHRRGTRPRPSRAEEASIIILAVCKLMSVPRRDSSGALSMCRRFSCLVAVSVATLLVWLCASTIFAAEQHGDAEQSWRPIQRIPVLQTALNQVVSVEYRSRPLGYVIQDLQRLGLDVSHSTLLYEPISNNTLLDEFVFDYRARNVPLRTVLDQFASAAGLEVEYHEPQGQVVLWKQAPPGRIAELAEIVRDENSPIRCQAIRDLGKLVDKQIYPVLFWAMKHGSEPMAVLSESILEEHHLPMLRYSDNLSGLADGLQRLIDCRPTSEMDHRLRLAAQLRGEAAERILIPLLDDCDSDLCLSAIQLIPDAEIPRAADALYRLMKKTGTADGTVDASDKSSQRLREIRTAALAAIANCQGPKASRAIREMSHSYNWSSYRLGLLLIGTGSDKGVDIALDFLRQRAAGDRKQKSNITPISTMNGGVAIPVSEVEVVVAALARARAKRAVVPIARVLEDPLVAARRSAVSVLVSLGDQRAVEPLARSLRDPDVHLDAAIALTRFGDPRGTEHLVALLQDERPSIQLAAAKHLLLMGNEDGRDALIALLDHVDADVGKAALRCLATFNEPAAASVLVRQLEHEEPKMRSEAVVMIRHCRPDGVAEALAGALADPERATSETAIAWATLRDATTVRSIVELLDHSSAKVRRLAALALAHFGGRDHVEALVELADDGDVAVRQELAKTLARIDDENATRAAAALLEDNEAAVRDAVARELGVYQRASSAVQLLSSIDDNDRSVRRTAMQALLRISEPSSIEQLALVEAGLTSSPSTRARSGARLEAPELSDFAGSLESSFYARSEDADPYLGEQLLRLAKHSNAAVRTVAVKALAATGDTWSVPPMIAALHDDDLAVRSVAVEGLGYWVEDDSDVSHIVAALLRALQDVDPAIREHAANVLGNVEEEDPRVRKALDQFREMEGNE